jgi:hypothetical protein
MFLSSVNHLQHELDFRFKIDPETNEYLFIHHGLSLSDLVGRIDLAEFGSTFYMTEATNPFDIEEAIADTRIFEKHYGVKPALTYGRYLRFDIPCLSQFFSSTKHDTLLACTIVGTVDEEMTEEVLWRSTATLGVGQKHISLFGLWNGCWLKTHDNHFFALVSQSTNLLRNLIDESILGFFHQVRAFDYKRLPTELIDLVLAKYHTASLVCFPTARSKGREFPSGVQVNDNEIRALIETAESSWTSYEAELPVDLLGRGLLMSYNFKDDHWSWQERVR